MLNEFMIDMFKEEDKKYTCELHTKHNNEKPLSPCRGKLCNTCFKRKVDGYSNPDHVSNPFGYLYLFPEICVKCSIENKKCMWCYIKN